MYFLSVQMSGTDQFSGEKQHGNLVPVAHSRRVIGVDVEHLDAKRLRCRQQRKPGQHLLAQAAAGA